MEYQKYNFNSYNVHTIKTNKFKTVRMEIIFSNKVDKNKMTLFSFLADILSDSSKKYRTRKDIAIRLEELYKTIFYSTTNKIGNLFTISFVLEFINQKYIKEKDYLENVIKFPFEIINNPQVNAKEFNITNFNIVKKRLKEEIESIKESSERLALINSLKEMDATSPSSFRLLGTLEDLENITPASLYDAYNELFNHFNCDIFIIGNVDMKNIVKIIQNIFHNHIIKINNQDLLVKNQLKKKPIIKTKKSNFVQSTLVMIYNINNLDKFTKDTSFHLFNYLLGSGGINAKLYKNLRTDNSLCYSVRSLYLKYDELLIVLVSLDKNNVSKAQKLIEKSISEMTKGEFSEEEIENAKKSLTFSLKTNLDNNVSILNNYVFNYFASLPLLDERIKLIKNISKDELIKCGKSLVLNTIYIQEGGE